MNERVSAGHTLLNYDINVVDVEAPSCDICRHQDHGRAWLFILLQDTKASVLLQVTLEAPKLGIFVALEVLNLNFRLSEDQNLQVPVSRDELFDKGLFCREVLAQD